MHIKESIYINATPESLFPYVIDPEKSEEWDENRQSMKILTEGPFGKGTRVRVVRKIPMGTVETVEEIIEFEENRLLFGDPGHEGFLIGVGGGHRPVPLDP